ncbi:hypothetical protein CHLNCDRAFT_137419 [Chlorella variabilis]|uniref:Helicase-associated domain-containing protein n=1 Tax=Chlorella variabilis TaxID=554065 RepID=E1ZME3_CHLVA|nr:hypothetical protein CHLNCDRAFT_137419 [Chlorella variabilis]EFN53095.1 hypothetical protein CHLNCDRAFT_137419 [Chlorella variabilis]|eukprot:XP_005845197.1 hypothetical protein CHLNCDRAFT_137419 [Chlorella variabilis]
MSRAVGSLTAQTPAAQRPQRQCAAARRPAAATRQPRQALPQRQRHVCCRASATSSEAAQLLDQFWMARGVVDEQQRRQLVAAAGSLQVGESEEQYEQLQLPSLSAAWFLEEQQGSSPEVAAVSRRILALQQLLGGGGEGGVDVVWMVVREPRLLSADFRSIMQRMFDMKVAEGSEGLDVLQLVAQQPALLLQEGAGVSADETAAERLQAWQHGLVSDNSAEWARRYSQLQQYAERYGDAHVGYRDGDDAELTRWAAKQRSEHRSGQLQAAKQEQLQAAGFEFDGETAEWLRWFNEVQAFNVRHGHCQPYPLAHPNDFLLINWCSVQRIMRRCGVLAPERAERLEALGFDWSGADPLS